MRKFLAALVGLLLAAGPAAAAPDGVWELDTKDTRFALETCGDGTQLCGNLVWLKDTDYNVQYQRFLNQPMAYEIRMTGPNRWKGDMRILGHKVAGTITQNSADHMTLSGCAFLVVCKTYEMYRVTP